MTRSELLARIRALKPLRTEATAYALNYQPAPTQAEWGQIEGIKRRAAKLRIADQGVVARRRNRTRTQPYDLPTVRYHLGEEDR